MSSQATSCNMNTSIVFTAEAKESIPYAAMAQILKEQIGLRDDCYIVESAPDVVHVFGLMDSATKRVLTHYRDLCIPTVFTPCDGLARYTASKQTISHKTAFMPTFRRLLMTATAILSTGKEEGNALATTAPKAEIEIVPNAAVTSSITPHDMADAIIRIYGTAFEKNEQQVAANIVKTIGAALKGHDTDTTGNIKSVCAKLLYARYLNNRGLLSTPRLEELGRMFVETDYDEDRLAFLLPRIKIRKFTAGLLALLDERGYISEGFMPIDRARKPMEIITVNTKQT